MNIKKKSTTTSLYISLAKYHQFSHVDPYFPEGKWRQRLLRTTTGITFLFVPRWLKSDKRKKQINQSIDHNQKQKLSVKKILKLNKSHRDISQLRRVVDRRTAPGWSSGWSVARAFVTGAIPFLVLGSTETSAFPRFTTSQSDRGDLVHLVIACVPTSATPATSAPPLSPAPPAPAAPLPLAPSSSSASPAAPGPPGPTTSSALSSSAAPLPPPSSTFASTSSAPVDQCVAADRQALRIREVVAAVERFEGN